MRRPAAVTFETKVTATLYLWARWDSNPRHTGPKPAPSWPAGVRTRTPTLLCAAASLREGFGLTVTRGAQVAQVLATVVQAVAVDVVDLQDEAVPSPSVTGAASRARVGNPDVVECTSQEGCVRSRRSGFQTLKDLCCGFAVRGTRATAMALAGEVSSRQTVRLNVPFEAGASAAVVDLAQDPQDSRPGFGTR